MAGTNSNFNAGYNSGTISQVNHNNILNVSSGHVEIQVGVTDPVLKELYAHTAASAMHNSAARRDAPKCHPETRQAVQENISSWISHREEEGQPRQLLWLTGPAGTGKTAIMGTIAEELERSGQLVASFYFAAYTGLIETTSKDRFVTTLAYQLQRHRALNTLISNPMLSTLQADPALIKSNLKTQMEALILQPFRNAAYQQTLNSHQSLVILVDGVDECGQGGHADGKCLREQDQIEVLSTLLQALCDPTFPCRIIVASRPENWIRHFFAEATACRITEIFLDDKYDPDKDIELFLNAKFAELSRRYNFAPSTWPREKDIRTLVDNASGQFIYAATVIRFIDSHGQLPKKQLTVVLSTAPLENGPSPFAPLDALYIAILNSSPSPSETVLWLKAYQRLSSGVDVTPSAWSINCLFESSEGQARLLLGLPSLVFTEPHQDTNSFMIGPVLSASGSSIRVLDQGITQYSFYHKSFLDFLDDPGRSGVAFPDVTDERVVQWIWERIHRVLKSAGPESPIDEMLLPASRNCFTENLFAETHRVNWNPPMMQQSVLSKCNPAAWYTGHSALVNGEKKLFLQLMFILVHTQCRFYRPCFAGCKRWRKALLGLPKEAWWPADWDSVYILLDRFCIKRVDHSGIYEMARSHGLAFM
ncbi:hypothetical protein NMY22_g4138 [Coprinellus aureogranulatus]|nr:hypothetical protein NMY22_g4138 [Coprinellus aureogranulatus]